MKKIIILAVAGLTLASAAAYAHMHQGQAGSGTAMHQGQGHMGQGHMGQGSTSNAHSNHASQPKGDTGPSSLAFQGSNAKMHAAMNITFTGDADVDFVKGMIPHHQGAIDMAKTALAFGKDPAVRKLAEEIVKAQESEIALMRDWLTKNSR